MWPALVKNTSMIWYATGRRQGISPTDHFFEKSWFDVDQMYSCRTYKLASVSDTRVDYNIISGGPRREVALPEPPDKPDILDYGLSQEQVYRSLTSFSLYCNHLCVLLSPYVPHSFISHSPSFSFFSSSTSYPRTPFIFYTCTKFCIFSQRMLYSLQADIKLTAQQGPDLFHD